MRYLFLTTLCALTLAACGGDQTGETTAAPDTKAQAETELVDAKTAESQELAALVDEHFERNLELNPVRATSLGDHRWDDQFANSIGPEHRARTEALGREFLERINSIEPGLLEGQDLLTWEVFKTERENDIESLRFPGYLIPVNQFFSTPNFFAQMGSGGSLHPFKTVKNYDDFLGRMDGFSVWIDQAIENMREGMAAGVINPRILMEKTLPQLEAHVVDDVTESLFYRPVENMPEDFSVEDRERLAAAYSDAIRNVVVPAYARLRDFIRDEYLPATRDTVGLYALPDGEAWYAYSVRMRTTTDLTPEQIHQIGLEEVGRIHGEMRSVMADVGFDGDLKDFFEFMNDDPQFYFTEREDLINGYRDMREYVHALAPKLFKRFPEADYEIRAVEPFREKSSSGGSYQRAAPDGSRPGVFYANAYDLNARPKWAMESLFLHEAVPGHHFQIALQQEVEELPRFRRFGGFTAYIEGWGLYAESLGKEMGVYTDPYQYFGALNAELWRAVRLVVDTGLHAKGWTRQDVLDYMYANTAVKEARAVSEAERYIAWPGQALAYKIGQLKIRELRDRAEAQLGSSFDPREFHEAILIDGSLPLDVLETKIDRWIADQQG